MESANSFLQEARRKVAEVYRFHDPADIFAVDYILALTQAQYLKGLKDRIPEPSWGYLVGGAGSGKSELVQPLCYWDRVFMVDAITPKSLLSGKQHEHDVTKNCSMLHAFNNRVLCLTDFTVQSKQDAKNSEELFGLLRKAFDGSLAKLFGNEAGFQATSCDFGLLVCTTPMTADFFAVLNQVLGERFLAFRIRRQPVACPREAALRSQGIEANTEGKARRRKELRDFIQGGMEDRIRRGLESTESNFESFYENETLGSQLAKLATLVSFIRANPSEEGPTEGTDHTRVLFQLRKLAISRAILDGRDTLHPEDLRFASRIAHDTVPPLLNRVVAALRVDTPISSGELAVRLGWTPKGFGNRLRQLAHLGLAVTHNDNWRLSEEAETLLAETSYFEGYLYPPPPEGAAA